MKNTVARIGSAVVTFLSIAPVAFAQTPAYTMNADVQTAATGLLTSLTAQIYSIIPVAIGLVGGVVVTLFGLRWLIGFVRSNMHG